MLQIPLLSARTHVYFMLEKIISPLHRLTYCSARTPVLNFGPLLAFYSSNKSSIFVMKVFLQKLSVCIRYSLLLWRPRIVGFILSKKPNSQTSHSKSKLQLYKNQFVYLFCLGKRSSAFMCVRMQSLVETREARRFARSLSPARRLFDQ